MQVKVVEQGLITEDDMKINLLELAQKVQDTYTEVECSFGPIKVYHIPNQLIWTYKLDRPEPVQPTVSMKLATGDFQERLVKQGDKGYEKWLLDSRSYADEKAELQFAARYVEALRGIEYPEDMSISPPMAEHRYNGHWPQEEVLQKKIWLDYTILAIASDTEKILGAIAEMATQEAVTSEEVENVKKNSASTSSSRQKRKQA